MTRLAVCAGILSASSVIFASTPQRSAPKGPPAKAPNVSTVATCAADLGTGVTTTRRFCDVIMTAKPADSIVLTIPAHRGAAKLYFDLHNRFAMPPESAAPAMVFARNSAIVAILGPKGEIGRGAVVSEFRTVADLFDRIVGQGGPGGNVKSVGPGSATPVEMLIPAGVASVGIVGVRLDVTNRLGKQTYDTPGRPIAIASNLRVEYTALR